MVGRFSDTSEQCIMEKMRYPQNVSICKGKFPEMAIKKNFKEPICFINLDMDLYLPTYEGLKFCSPLMVPGGVVLIHDYFNLNFVGVKKAVSEFLSENNGLYMIPIGDGLSVCIVGF